VFKHAFDMAVPGGAGARLPGTAGDQSLIWIP
jgi:hypothetical protein